MIRLLTAVSIFAISCSDSTIEKSTPDATSIRGINDATPVTNFNNECGHFPDPLSPVAFTILLYFLCLTNNH